MRKTTNPDPVLNVRVGDGLTPSLARARRAMATLSKGNTPAPYYGVGFAEIGQMLAVFTPKRWELIAKLRELGPVTVAELARQLGRDYKNVHTDVGVLTEWLAVQRDDEGLVSVPWSEIVVDMKLPKRMAA